MCHPTYLSRPFPRAIHYVEYRSQFNQCYTNVTRLFLPNSALLPGPVLLFRFGLQPIQAFSTVARCLSTTCPRPTVPPCTSHHIKSLCHLFILLPILPSRLSSVIRAWLDCVPENHIHVLGRSSFLSPSDIYLTPFLCFILGYPIVIPSSVGVDRIDHGKHCTNSFIRRSSER